MWQLGNIVRVRSRRRSLGAAARFFIFLSQSTAKGPRLRDRNWVRFAKDPLIYLDIMFNYVERQSAR
jgi:hypothetical protein